MRLRVRCTVRESRSDDRRFSIFSGTKTLHLRAETREDRAAWLEALRRPRNMFPRMSSSEMVGPGDTAAAVAVSTERLRQRLQQEGTEKVDLENTLVDESQRQSKEYGSASKSRHEKYSEGSASESDDYNEPQDPAEETDDDENIYFDTRDFLSSSSFKSSGSDFQRSEAGSDDEDDYPMDGIDPSMKSVGISYPYVRRRKKLPDPVEKEKGVSLWSMIKDNIGKDLTKVCLPVYFNEPLSSLQKCFEDLEYSYLIDRASEWGKRGNSLMRILSVAAFAVSGYASTDGRSFFQWSKVTTSIYNLILGKLYCDHYGTMRIQGNREYSCKLKFKEQSIIDRNPHQVQGVVQDRSGRTVATLFGKWDEIIWPVLQARKMQESGWKPRWFAKDKATDTYRYTGGYWESREKGSWEGCPDIFGQVPNDLMITD
ncbi:hypothetical protein HU200_066937 [Digitaria exilis]|uniref:PH domain-containing protein n=1 Tax=Digitaria exilis TaxID=1010633 RepID=A0A834ZZG4_9POAL|nr:hypothetical protein HU200_066937 [Digitaria exilis]